MGFQGGNRERLGILGGLMGGVVFGGGGAEEREHEQGRQEELKRKAGF